MWLIQKHQTNTSKQLTHWQEGVSTFQQYGYAFFQKSHFIHGCEGKKFDEWLICNALFSFSQGDGPSWSFISNAWRLFARWSFICLEVIPRLSYICLPSVRRIWFSYVCEEDPWSLYRQDRPVMLMFCKRDPLWRCSMGQVFIYYSPRGGLYPVMLTAADPCAIRCAWYLYMFLKYYCSKPAHFPLVPNLLSWLIAQRSHSRCLDNKPKFIKPLLCWIHYASRRSAYLYSTY